MCDTRRRVGACPNPAGTVRPVESKWQRAWGTTRAFHAEPLSRDGERPSLPARPKAYVLEMLPYPSGEIHIGHVKNYTMGDVVAHFRRRNGAAVFHPMGYDAFGLPAENAAIETGDPPPRSSPGTSRASASRCGAWRSVDWETELATSDPEYYRWTQWIFLRLLEAGWPSAARPPSTGARSTRPCSPTSRSSTAAASAAAPR